VDALPETMGAPGPHRSRYCMTSSDVRYFRQIAYSLGHVEGSAPNAPPEDGRGTRGDTGRLAFTAKPDVGSSAPPLPESKDDK